jgi:hypothetical protein
MSKFVEALDTYKKQLNDLGIGFDEELLTKVTKALGPSIYLADASKVSCSDAEEKARVKNNFLIKKLGMTDGPALDAAIEEVCQTMGSSNRNKYRAVFHYLLVKKFGQESKFA